MRICFLAGANSVHSLRWIRFFRDRGDEVLWLSLAEPTVEIPSGIEFHRIGGMGAFGVLRAVRQARRLLREKAPDLLHVHSAGTYGLVGWLSGFHPMIVTAWGSDVLYAGRGLITGPLVRRVLAVADLITTDAQHMVEAMVGLGVPREKMELIYFGVETDRFSPGGRDEELLARLGVAGSPVVVSLRSFDPIYDVGSLVRAASRVIEELPDAGFLLLGAGPEEGELKRLAGELGIADRLAFPGLLPHDQVLACLQSADVYVSTSLSDAGIAASTAEAMACGLPVVVTDSGENRLWVEDDVSGYIVPTSAPEPLAERILLLARRGDGWGRRPGT